MRGHSNISEWGRFPTPSRGSPKSPLTSSSPPRPPGSPGGVGAPSPEAAEGGAGAPLGQMHTPAPLWKVDPEQWVSLWGQG